MPQPWLPGARAAVHGRQTDRSTSMATDRPLHPPASDYPTAPTTLPLADERAQPFLLLVLLLLVVMVVAALLPSPRGCAAAAATAVPPLGPTAVSGELSRVRSLPWVLVTAAHIQAGHSVANM